MTIELVHILVCSKIDEIALDIDTILLVNLYLILVKKPFGTKEI